MISNTDKAYYLPTMNSPIEEIFRNNILDSSNLCIVQSGGIFNSSGGSILTTLLVRGKRIVIT